MIEIASRHYRWLVLSEFDNILDVDLVPLTAAIGRPLFGQKSSAARARELVKPFTDSTSLLVEIAKNVFRFRFSVFWR